MVGIFQILVRWSQENSQGSRVEMDILLEVLTYGWRQESSYGYGEEIKDIQASFCFGYFFISLGEIIMVEGWGGLIVGSPH